MKGYKRLISLSTAFVMMFALSATAFAETTVFTETTVVEETTVAEETSEFDQFIQRFNPTFADVTEPIMAYTDEQGIRMTVLGAARYNTMSVIYMSLQDITGANRLTESTDFGIGLDISLDVPARSLDEPVAKRLPEDIYGVNSSRNMLYFDESTNTVYFEIRIAADVAVSNPLRVSASMVVFETLEFESEPILISLSEVDTADSLSIVPEESIFSWSGFLELDSIELPDKILLPGRLAEFPTNTDTHWISNTGIIDGQLRVQEIRTAEGFGAGGSRLNLIGADKEPILSTFSVDVRADESFTPVNFIEYLETYGSTPPYVIEEFSFDIDNIDNLADCTLVFTGVVTQGIRDNWQVNANMANTTNQVITITNNVLTEGTLYEFLTLTPIGLQILGNLADEIEVFFDDLDEIPEVIYAETSDGLIQLIRYGGTFDRSGSFRLDWRAESLIDVSAATAIVINDLRIPIP